MTDPIVEYLWRRFPHHCMTLTDPGVRLVIDLAARRAAAHDFVAPEHVCSWVNLMIFCGAYFDEDPLHDWARQSLQQARSAPRDDAMAMVFHALNANTGYLGAGSAWYRAALARVASLQYESLAQEPYGDAADRVRHWLRTAYPERCNAQPAAVDLVTARAAEWTARHALDPAAGAVVCALIILLFGSHADRDPIRWWAGEALASATGPATAPDKTRRVHAALVQTLRRFAFLTRQR